jgi:hypothetical protein
MAVEYQISRANFKGMSRETTLNVRNAKGLLYL